MYEEVIQLKQNQEDATNIASEKDNELNEKQMILEVCL